MNTTETLEEYAVRMRTFTKNRHAFPEEELAKYAGQWIAWSPDGASIVAHSFQSDMVVYDAIKSAGYDPGQCCISFIPEGDEPSLGGSSLCGIFPGASMKADALETNVHGAITPLQGGPSCPSDSPS